MMDFFYNKEVYTTLKTTIENEIGQVEEGYKKDRLFKGDIQPINAYSKATQWGSDVISEKELYCDEALFVGDILVYNNKSYEIEKAIEWDDFNIYALKGVDIVVG